MKEERNMANPFVHIELQTQDLATAKKFYQGLFAWDLKDVPMGGDTYTLIGVEEGTGGGMMKNPAPGAPSHWLPYVNVDDVATATEKAQSLGATVVRQKTEVPNEGWFSVIVDPAGAALGLWQSKAH
jgi:predicted enzyme related to lactoylglutathione lyase